MSGRAVMRTLLALGGLALLSACQRVAPPGPPQAGIAFVSERDGNQELYLIQPDGRGLVRLTDNPALDADPAWSPDGRQLAFRSRRDGSSDIFVMNADGSAPRNLIGDGPDSTDDEFAPAWSPDGKTLALITDRFYYLTGTSPYRIGSERAVHQTALMPSTGGAAEMTLLLASVGDQRTVTWSPDGRYLAFSATTGFGIRSPTHDINLQQYDRQTGQTTLLAGELGADLYPAWSHDGRWLAYQCTPDGNAEICLLELATGSMTNLTHHPATDSQPAWSPDDSQLVFVTDRDGNDELYLMQRDGTGLCNLTQNPARDFAPAWSPINTLNH